MFLNLKFVKYIAATYMNKWSLWTKSQWDKARCNSMVEYALMVGGGIDPLSVGWWIKKNPCCQSERIAHVVAAASFLSCWVVLYHMLDAI